VTDFYVLRRAYQDSYVIVGPLERLWWRCHQGLTWIDRGIWVGVRQAPLATGWRWLWFTTSAISALTVERGQSRAPYCRDDVLAAPAKDLPDLAPKIVREWVEIWVTGTHAREGADGVPMALHRIEDPIARQHAVKAYLDNRI